MYAVPQSFLQLKLGLRVDNEALERAVHVWGDPLQTSCQRQHLQMPDGRVKNEAHTAPIRLRIN